MQSRKPYHFKSEGRKAPYEVPDLIEEGILAMNRMDHIEGEVDSPGPEDEPEPELGREDLLASD